jgi:hypothetical protein
MAGLDLHFRFTVGMEDVSGALARADSMMKPLFRYPGAIQEMFLMFRS